MQGVDQYNRLITLFSMSNLHFDKYYKKVALILMDLTVTNVYLHYKIDNASLPLKYTRCTFMEMLQYQMITVDWSIKVRQRHTNDKKIETKEIGSLMLDRLMVFLIKNRKLVIMQYNKINRPKKML